MSAPSFSIVLPTLGRPTLERTLASCVPQLSARDEVIVVRDSFEDPDDVHRVRERVASFGPQFRYLEHDAGFHCFGVTQGNVGFAQATGDVFLAIGDDDAYASHALATLRTVMAHDPARPVLFQFLTPWREILWDEPRMMRSRIGGGCIAIPRAWFVPQPEDAHYPEVDFDWMLAILAKSPEPLWLKDVLFLARPDLRNGKVPTGVSRCSQCRGVRYHEDLTGGACVLCRPVAVSA